MSELTPQEPAAPDVRMTYDARISMSDTTNKAEVHYTGSYGALAEEARKLTGGGSGEGSEGGVVSGTSGDLPEGNSDSDGDFGAQRVSGAVLSRLRGGVGHMAVTVTQNVHRAQFGMDWTEVSKPIRTWGADFGESERPDLGKIREWESQREGNPSAYYDLKIGTEELEGTTKTLASFIARGIESYSRYAPVFTIALVVDAAERAADTDVRIGMVGDPQCPWGWKDAKGRSAADFVDNLKKPNSESKYEWLLVKSTLTPLPDGRHQWNLAWQGADTIEAELYAYPNGGTPGGAET